MRTTTRPAVEPTKHHSRSRRRGYVRIRRPGHRDPSHVRRGMSIHPEGQFVLHLRSSRAEQPPCRAVQPALGQTHVALQQPASLVAPAEIFEFESKV